MANLVQKQITDKNGVQGTRWVKADQPDAKLVPTVPAPLKAESEKARLKALKRAARAYVTEIAEGTDYDFDAYLDDAEDSLSSFSTITLKEIGEPAPNSFVKMFTFKHMMEYGADEGEVRDLFHVLHVLESYGVDDPNSASMFVRGLSQYAGLHELDARGEYPEERAKQCTALLGLAYLTENLIYEKNAPETALTHIREYNSQDRIVLTDERLIALVTKRPDEAEAIMDFMYERQTADLDRIIEVVYSDNPALAEGIL